MSENAVESKPKNPSTRPLGKTPYHMVDDRYGMKAQQLSEDLPPGLSQDQRAQIIQARIREREQGKVERITDLRSVLTDLLGEDGKYKSLIESTVSYTEQLMPLLSLIGGSPDDPREGRGVYHNVEVGGQEVIVYVKGSGNKDFLSTLGYPEDTESLIFDKFSLSGSTHPRIQGTETLSWGMLEFINAAVIFAETAKREGWMDVSDAVKAGVTIPVGLLSFPELSKEKQKLLQEKIAMTANPAEKEFLSWEGNKHLGAVGLIVPGMQRKERTGDPTSPSGLRSADNFEALKSESVDAQLARINGRTLRRLLDMGIIYSFDSSHGQNLYRTGFMAQADNSDLVFLGDYDTPDKRAALIYATLMRNENLTPLFLPKVNNVRLSHHEELAIPFEDVERGQREFWEEMLTGIVDEHAVRALPRLMPLFREQINLAVAKLFVGRSDQWEDILKERKRVLHKHDDSGAMKVLGQKIVENLSDGLVENVRDRTGADDPLGVSAMTQFLQTGDVAKFSEHPKLQPYLALTDALFAIRDRKIRDSLIESIGTLQLMRERTAAGNKRDVIELFDNKHLSLLQELITSKQYREANEVVTILTEVQRWQPMENYVTTTEYPSTQYALQLLEMFGKKEKVFGRHGRLMQKGEQIVGFRKSRLEHLRTQVESFTKMFEFLERVGVSLTLTQSMPDIDMNSWTSERKVASPLILMANMFIATMRERVAKMASLKPFKNLKPLKVDSWREELALSQEKIDIGNSFGNFRSFATWYLLRLTNLERGDTSFGSATDVIAKLDGAIEDQQQELPELAYGHNLIMASYFSTRDSDRAKEYFDKATGYYQTIYRERQEEFGIDLASTSSDPTEFSDEQKARSAELAEKYKALGFPKVADFYQRQAVSTTG